MILYMYKEIPYDPENDLTNILNAEGREGWEFLMMTQKQVAPSVFTKNQPQVKLSIMLKKQYQSEPNKLN